MTTPTGTPESEPVPFIRELDRAECEAILSRNHVGRLAYSYRERIDIEPIHYVFRDGVINCRTAPGTKLDVLARSPYVAFEVDEVEGLWSWRSVVAHATVYRSEDAGSDHDRQKYREAVEALRTLVPETFTPDDPVPFRTVVLRVHIHNLEGREARVG